MIRKEPAVSAFGLPKIAAAFVELLKERGDLEDLDAKGTERLCEAIVATGAAQLFCCLRELGGLDQERLVEILTDPTFH